MDGYRGQDRFQAGPILDAPAARTVQIDQVEEFAPLLRPMAGHGGWIVAKNRLAAIVPLLEADTFAAA